MLERPLFGGYMSIELPEDAQDVSDVREIPDNQEVFTHSITDQSIIIEILEYVDESDEQALKTHYEDIAGSNEADGSDIMNTEEIPKDQLAITDCSGAYALKGQQMVSKFKESAKNAVYIHMGLVRLPQYETDILISFNNPVNINPESSSHGPVPVSASPWTDSQFVHCMRTLKIINPALFGT